jgi:nickel/cobalt exporter
MKALLAAAAAVLPALAAAHPLGNFTSNRYAAILVEPRAVQITYAVDLAELPTYRELAVVDADGDGTADEAERARYARRQAATIAANFVLTVDGIVLAPETLAAAAELTPGAGGLPTLRLDITYRAPLARLVGELAFTDRNFADRPGWQEIVAAPADGVQLIGSSVPRSDASRALRAYPDDGLQEPRRVAEARMRLAGGGAVPPAQPAPRAARSGAERFGDRLTALLTDPAPLGPWTLVMALLAAAMLGAFHALTPGHGKTIVGAYLVGARGTARHAILLGLVVTVTHTLGVFLLGLATLAASEWVVPERLYPWISIVSGLLVVAVGGSMASARLRHAHGHADDHHHGHDHDHAHAHLPPPGTRITTRSLLALGISGGLLPCPSALVVMLGAIALHRIAFGLALIVAFSIGLAGVLTAVGIALVYARGLFERLPFDGRLARYAPVASALVVSFAGAALVVEALWQMGASS